MSVRNNRRRMLVMAGLATGLLAASNVVFAQIPCEYEVTTLQFPIDCGIGTVITTGLSLNENGAVVGYYYCPLWENFQGFMWTAEDGFETLDPPEGVVEVFAADINDRGVICGTVIVSRVGNRGFVYDKGEWTILPPVVDVPGARSSAAAIDNSGTVVGQRSLTEEPNPKNAYIWSAEGGFTDLGVMKGGVSQATGITERGNVVGSTGGLASPGQEAFRWQDGDLTLLGYVPQGISSWAIAASSQGGIAGGGLMDPDQRPDIFGQPALWKNGKWQLLGVLPNCEVGGTGDMNDDEMIVGLCVEPDNTRRAFMWTDGTMFDLNDLVPRGLDISIERGWGISNSGRIVADGHDARNHSVTFLLAPVVAPLGDLDGDCHVGATDFLILLVAWGPCADCKACPVDFDNNCVVGASDLLILLVNWG